MSMDWFQKCMHLGKRMLHSDKPLHTIQMNVFQNLDEVVISKQPNSR